MMRQWLWPVVLTIIFILVAQGIAQTIPAPTPSTLPVVTGISGITAPPLEDEVYKFYSQNLRSIFFTGLLTLSSFLLAANAFIVINLKKEVYDSKGYVKYVRGIRQTNSSMSFYGPLKRLSRLLLYNIALALVASVTQVTVGIIWKSRIGATICITTAGAAISLLFVTLLMINANLNDWFEHMEKEAAELEAKDKAEEEAKAAAAGQSPRL
jgi:hypothetical protein